MQGPELPCTSWDMYALLPMVVPLHPLRSWQQWFSHRAVWLDFACMLHPWYPFAWLVVGKVVVTYMLVAYNSMPPGKHCTASHCLWQICVS
jgi:hypothetical protein